MLLFGSQYDSVPNARVTYNFASLNNRVRVVADFVVVTNPGSAFERVNPITNQQDLNNLYSMLQRAQAAVPVVTQPAVSADPVMNVQPGASSDQVPQIIKMPTQD